MRLIAFVGKKQSGKSTSAKHLIEAKGYQRLSFAQPLRDLCAKAFELPESYFTDERLKEHPIGDIIIGKDCVVELLKLEGLTFSDLTPEAQERWNGGAVLVCLTPRQILQKVGSEVFREGISNTYWIDKAGKSLKPDGKYVIDDVRFLNEGDFVKRHHGSLVRIKRPGPVSSDTHISEMEMDAIETDFTILNTQPLPEFLVEINSIEGLI